jgi:hypothetical protein
MLFSDGIYYKFLKMTVLLLLMGDFFFQLKPVCHFHEVKLSLTLQIM